MRRPSRPPVSVIRAIRRAERSAGLPKNDAAARWLRQHDPDRL